MPFQTAAPVLGTWNTPRLTANGGTAFAGLVPPFPGPSGNSPMIYNPLALNVPAAQAVNSLKANWLAAPNFGITRLTSLYVQAGATAHTVYVLRPLNWTYFTAGLAKNTTVIPDAAATGLAYDPGVYSTKYAYPTAGATAPAGVADNTISSNDYVVYQLTDGTWQLDTVASGTYGSTLTLTTGTPNRAGGAIPTGGVLFFFGISTDSDPATGAVQTGFDTKASTLNTWQDNVVGLLSGLHVGDPFVIYDANGTNADNVVAAGYYAGW